MTTATRSQPRSQIDFAAVVGQADLGAVLEADLGAPKVIGGRKSWHCPFHHDQNPSFYLWDDGRRWRCWPCGLEGNVIDYITRRESISSYEAAKRLDPKLGQAAINSPRPTPPKAVKPTPKWQIPEWQEAVQRIVDDARMSLWSREGRPAREWLRARGLADHTIGRFSLGFNPQRFFTPPLECLNDKDSSHISVARGIVIPWPAPSQKASECASHWAGANVRRLKPDVWEPVEEPRYIGFNGSERGHLFPHPELLDCQGTLPALIVESELDGLLAWQEAGWIVHVGATGGAAQPPLPSALAFLARCPWWLLATDRDKAGDEAAWTWRERNPAKTKRILPPHGKDLTEFVQNGGNVREWLASDFRRVGIPWPLRA
jgi:DNA primase